LSVSTVLFTETIYDAQRRCGIDGRQISVKTNFPERRLESGAACVRVRELFKIEISRVLRRSSLIEFRCIPRSNTVPRSATIGRLLNPTGAPTLISPHAKRGTDAFTATASNNLANAR